MEISSRYRRRRVLNQLMLMLAAASMLIGLAFLSWILWTLLSKGLGAFSIDFFTKSTPAPGSEGGGMANAIVGSLLMVGTTTLIATPIGILAGVYLAEVSANSRFASLTRFMVDVMLSAPSIVIGLFVYAIAVATTNHFSGWAGSLALGLIAVPVVMRTTENMLRLVPAALREAAFALGAPRWRVSLQVTLKAVRGGVITGVMLATARIFGETAPLLFTALNDQFFNADMSKPMASLPVTIYNFAMSPYEEWQQLAWGGAALIALVVLALNVAARLLTADPKQKR